VFFNLFTTTLTFSFKIKETKIKCCKKVLFINHFQFKKKSPALSAGLKYYLNSFPALTFTAKEEKIKVVICCQSVH